MTPALFFFVLSIGLFSYVLFLKLYLRLEREDKQDLFMQNEDISIENVNLQIKVKHLENKINKKKELLEIQDKVVQQLQEEIINFKLK